MSVSIAIPIKPGELHFIQQMSAASEINGASQIRKNPANRTANLAVDALIGQLGTAALHKYWFGHLLEYSRQRWYQNQYPHSGDGGHDIPVGNVDVKASLLKNPDKESYHLLVRHKERYPNWIYVCALVEFADNNVITVYLMGWAATSDLPTEVIQDGLLQGAYALPVTNLRQLMPLRWFWNERK